MIKTENKKQRTSKEVLDRYRNKTYKVVTLNLRKVDDKDCLEFLEREKSLGLSPTEVFRKLVRGEYD